MKKENEKSQDTMIWHYQPRNFQNKKVTPSPSLVSPHNLSRYDDIAHLYSKEVHLQQKRQDQDGVMSISPDCLNIDTRTLVPHDTLHCIDEPPVTPPEMESRIHQYTETSRAQPQKGGEWTLINTGQSFNLPIIKKKLVVAQAIINQSSDYQKQRPRFNRAKEQVMANKHNHRKQELLQTLCSISQLENRNRLQSQDRRQGHSKEIPLHTHAIVTQNSFFRRTL